MQQQRSYHVLSLTPGGIENVRPCKVHGILPLAPTYLGSDQFISMIVYYRDGKAVLPIVTGYCLYLQLYFFLYEP